MTSLFVHLPGPPKGKGRARFVRATGRTYTPEATVNYEAALRLAAHQAMRGQPLLMKGVEVRISAVFPIPTSWSRKKWADAIAGLIVPTVKPDCDNIFKCVDALNGVVWNDDKQIVRASILKKYGDAPGLTIYVDELAGEQS